MRKDIIQKNDRKTVVLDYVPKEFPVVVTPSAESFVSSQGVTSSDFKISELVADQVGISELQRKSIENKIEEMALERLKRVEERAYEEAYDLGLIEGTKKAFEERKLEFEDQIQKLQNLLDGFQNIKTQLMVENEGTFMRMIHELATKLAMRTIDENEGAIIEVLKKVVQEIQTEDQITVKISVEDMVFLESYKEKTGHQFDLLERMKLEASENISRGGCIVETNYGSIDATVKQRISKAWSLIEGRLPKYKNNKVVETKTDETPDNEGLGDDESGEE